MRICNIKRIKACILLSIWFRSSLFFYFGRILCLQLNALYSKNMRVSAKMNDNKNNKNRFCCCLNFHPISCRTFIHRSYTIGLNVRYFVFMLSHVAHHMWYKNQTNKFSDAFVCWYLAAENPPLEAEWNWTEYAFAMLFSWQNNGRCILPFRNANLMVLLFTT